MQIISRVQWGARPPKYRRAIPLPSRELWLHHSASPSGGASRIRAIQDFHMNVHEWPDIAYTFIIAADGLIYEGVPPGFRGTHTANHNVSGHAICLLGDFNAVTPTQAALTGLVELVRYGHAHGWWPLGFTGGHRDTRGGAAGDCPGDSLYALIPSINQTIQGDDMPLTPDEIQQIAAAVWKYAMEDATSGSTSNAQALLRITRDQVAQTLSKVNALGSGNADGIVDEIADRLYEG